MKVEKKAIAYFRVSTDMQMEDLSLETQEKGGEIFAKDNNVKIIRKFTDVMSGGNSKRAGFLEAQRYLEEHKDEVDYFIAYDVSRIARDAFAFLSLFNKLNILGVKLKLINNPNLDTDSPMGKLIITILAAIFEFFRFDSADRTRDNMIVRAKEGKRMNNAPYGYQMINKKMVIVPEEAEIIKFVFEQYLKGHGIVAIEKMINRDRSTIKNWLQNKVYAGYNIFGVTRTNKSTFKQVKNPDPSKIVEVKGEWEPIISLETWQKVADIMTKNKELRMKNIEKTSYLLAGLLFHTCGSKFRGSAGRKGSYYYRCIGCNRCIKTDTIDKKVLDELFNSDILLELNNISDKRAETKKKEITRLKYKRITLLNKEKKLIDLYTEDLISKDEYAKRRNEIKEEVLKIDVELINLENEEEQLQQDINFKEIFVEALSNLKTANDKKEANKILKKIINKIEVNDNKEIFIYLNF